MMAAGAPMGIESLCFPHNPPSPPPFSPAPQTRFVVRERGKKEWKKKPFIGCQFA